MKFLLQAFNNIAGAIGRAIIYYQHMKVAGQRQDLTDDLLYIFLLVIGWYDYKLAQSGLKIRRQNKDYLMNNYEIFC